MSASVSRRSILAAAAGGLTVMFARPPAGAAQGMQASAGLRLDNWLRIAPDGAITVFTGKAELGQGIATAIAQLAAEGLRAPLASITMVTADTARTPNEGITAGSHSVDTSGMAVLSAAIHMRELMIADVAQTWAIPPDRVLAEDGRLTAPGRSASYGEVAARMDRTVLAPRLEKPPSAGRLMGRSAPRLDAPAKVRGDEAFIHDMRPGGLVHARVLRAPAQGQRLVSLDAAAAAAMDGVLKVVRIGQFVAVIAKTEWQAVEALAALEGAAQWSGDGARPADEISDHLQRAPAQLVQAARKGAASTHDGAQLNVRYTRGYLMHGSIGPSCALARFEDGAMTIWTHSQGVFLVRDAIARLMGLPADKVRAIHAPGAGCYGHNGADDAACDAALIAREYPGATVRVQWTRRQEHSFEPYGPAMAGQVEAKLGADGRIEAWRYVVSSNTHTRRPMAPGLLLAAQELPDGPKPPPPFAVPMPEGDGHRNSLPLYEIPNLEVDYRLVTDQPVRVSSLRGLGAHLNVVAIEGAMDELAAAAGADPVVFRRRHLLDPRALAVIDAASEGFGWSRCRRKGPRHGRGFAFARYKNLAGYCAVAMDVRVAASGEITLGRVFAACDVGQPVSPDGVLNQVEGGVIQSLSWTMLEAVSFGSAGQETNGWADYPILRFSQLPEKIDLKLIERPGEAFLGAGEIAAGPTAAALVNAVSNAVGARVRDLPLRPAHLLAAGKQT